MPEKHRLLSGTHRRVLDDGTRVVFETGDVLEPTDAELDAFGDKFERVTDGAPATEPADETPTAAEAESETEAGDVEGHAETEDTAESAEDDGGDDVDAVEGGLAVPEGFDHPLPDDFPATLPDDYQTLRALAPANGIDGNQSKADLLTALENVRDQTGGEA